MRSYVIERGQILIANDETAEVVGEQELMHAFASSLKALRQACNLSITGLGEKLDMSQQTLSTYENCTLVPSLLQAVYIAAYFGFTVEDMILSGLDMRQISVEEEYTLNHFNQ